MRAAIVAFLALAGAAQAAQPFSHRLHLKLMTCRDCHAPAWTSTSVQDRLLPPDQLCQKCHKGMSVSAQRGSMVVHFDHARHLKLGNLVASVTRAVDAGTYVMPSGASRAGLNTANECAACHRGLAEPDHAGRPVLAHMADCMVCHNQIDPPDSCYQCHAASANLKPANHTPDFMDTHTSGKLKLDKSTCAVCHGRRFTCLGCH